MFFTKWRSQPLPLFFQNVFALNGVMHSLANQQLPPQDLWWQQCLSDIAFVWGQQSWNAPSALTTPSAFRSTHGQTLLYISTSSWDPFQTTTHSYVVGHLLMATSLCKPGWGRCILHPFMFVTHLTPPDMSSGPGREQPLPRRHREPSVTRLMFPRVLWAHLCPRTLRQDVGPRPPWAGPHLVQLPASEVMSPSGTGTFRPLRKWVRPVCSSFCPIVLHHIFQRLFGIFLVPGVNEKIPRMKQLT